MRVKVKPEDFVVKEILSVTPQDDGDYEIWLLEKRGTNTLDVILDLARKNRIPASLISYCGLKDRHSLSYQYISAPKGCLKVTRGVNYKLSFFGYFPRQLEKRDLSANEFTVVVRDVGLPEEMVEREIEAVNTYHLVNYYDEQRFGSARHGKGFVAKELIRKNYQGALKLLIATPSKWDESKIKKFRRCVEENWGRWEKCIELAPTSWERKLLEFLSGRDFSKSTAKKAFSLVDRKILELCMNAYQAYIWNLVAGRVLISYFTEPQLIKVKYLYGFFYFYRELEQELKQRFEAMSIPTVSPRLKVEGMLRRIIESILQEEGISSIQAFRTNVKGCLFRSVKRQFIVKPQIEYCCEPDELYPGKRKWRLHFLLPAGSYATIVIKRLFYREMH